MIVRKLNHNGREVWRYPAELVKKEPHLIVIQALFNRDDLNLGYTTFRRGDLFVEFFYSDRWYNVFAIYEKDGALRGWYCNICRPAIWDDQRIDCEDLELDVWVEPDGTSLVLDQDEFEQLNLAADDKEKSLLALNNVLELAQNGHLPR
ncbi:MAG: DUF402 domain-containing protein [Ardenticatenaceae bacterium]|nr:DUF402 domain-containing protein [Ardenticatenaceae bacterium]